MGATGQDVSSVTVLDYDKEAARYDATRGGDARADAAAGAIATLLPESAGLIVDLACGTGIVTTRLAGPGRSVLGIDRSSGMVRVAAGRLPGRVAVGDATCAPAAC
jgi:2-polyprenyl-3-methyl-5-hydroxy-6-metoxy-1,4-benzoquinol methylase